MNPLLWWGILAICGLVEAAAWLCDRVDAYLARCTPDQRWGTYVWHEHRLLRWRWLASHSRLSNGQDYREYIRWAPMRDDDIQVVVYPAGTRIGQ